MKYSAILLCEVLRYEVRVRNATLRSTSLRSTSPQSAIKKAFTLVELLVVLALIILISAVTLPSIGRIFTSGADAMAYNLTSVQLEAARVTAMANNAPAGIHAQLADTSVSGNADLAGVQFMTVVSYDGDKFGHVPGYIPRRLPGTAVLGDAENFRAKVSGSWNWEEISDAELTGSFTRFSIIFSAVGEVITRIDGQDIEFDSSDGLFSGGQQLWSEPPAAAGITAITIFNYADILPLNASDRDDYLDESSQYLPVNIYTGRMYKRK